MFDISAENIQQLHDKQLVELLDALLTLEAYEHNIPENCIHVPSSICAKDGGEDGRIAADKLETAQFEAESNQASTHYLFSGINLFQVKASAMPPGKCYKEVLEANEEAIKPNIKSVLDQGGTYILFCNQNFTVGGVNEKTNGKKEYNGILGRVERIKEALKSVDQKYEDAHIEIYDSNKISMWTNRYLSTIVLVRELIKNPVPLGLKTWQQLNSHDLFKNSYCDYDDKIRNEKAKLADYFKQSKSVARISGKVRIGKTRLSIEVFRGCMSKQVVYMNAELGDTVSLATKFLSWSNQKLHGIIIVDNCDMQLHRNLAQEINKTDNQSLSLLTIGPESNRGCSGELSVELEPLSYQSIKSIITKHRPEIASDQGVLEKLFTLSAGYPGFAIRFANSHNPNKPLQQLSEEQYRKILWEGKEQNDDALNVIQAYSLFGTVGTLDEVESEYEFVATKVANFTDPYRFYQIGRRYFFNKGIIAQIGDYDVITSIKLALYLAEQWWNECPLSRAKKLFMDIFEKAKQSNELVIRFFRRLVELKHVEKVRKFTNLLFQEGGCLNNQSLLQTNPERLAFFPIFSEAYPVEVIASLKCIFLNPDEDLIHANRDYINEAFKAIRHVLSNQEAFSDAIYLLIDLVVMYSHIFLYPQRLQYALYVYNDCFDPKDMSFNAFDALALLREIFLPNSKYGIGFYDKRIQIISRILEETSLKQAVLALQPVNQCFNAQDNQVAYTKLKLIKFILKANTDPRYYEFPNKIQRECFKENNVAQYYQNSIDILKEMRMSEWENESLTEQINNYNARIAGDQLQIDFTFDKVLATAQGQDAAQIGLGTRLKSSEVEKVVNNIRREYIIYNYNIQCFIKAICGYNYTPKAVNALAKELLEIKDIGPLVLLGVLYTKKNHVQFANCAKKNMHTVLLRFNFSELEGASEKFQAFISYAWQYFFINQLKLSGKDKNLMRELIDMLAGYFVAAEESYFIDAFTSKKINIADVLLQDENYKDLFEDFILKQVESSKFQALINALLNSNFRRYLLAEISHNKILSWCDSLDKAMMIAGLTPISEHEETTKMRLPLVHGIDGSEKRWAKLLKKLIIRYADASGFKKIIYKTIESQIKGAYANNELLSAHFDRAKSLFNDLLSEQCLEDWATEKLHEIDNLQSQNESKITNQKINACGSRNLNHISQNNNANNRYMLRNIKGNLSQNRATSSKSLEKKTILKRKRSSSP